MDNNCCCNKKTKRSPDEKKLITNRLNRINGQINGINKVVLFNGGGMFCPEILGDNSTKKIIFKINNREFKMFNSIFISSTFL